MKKLIAYIFLLSFVISLIIAPLRGGYITVNNIFDGPDLSMILGFVIYFIFTVYCLNYYVKKIQLKVILAAILTGRLILDIPFRIIDFDATLISLPDTLFHILGIVLAYCAFHFKYKRVLIFLIGISFTSLIAVKGLPFWYNYIYFDSFTGYINKDNAENKIFYDLNINSQDQKELENRYLLLDMWHTYCGVCYAKFPQIQDLFNKYKDHPDFLLFTVHRFSTDAKYKESSNTGSEILRNEGYTFPNLSIADTSSFFKKYNVRAYPTILVFDKKGNLIFRGNIESASGYIDKLLNE